MKKLLIYLMFLMLLPVAGMAQSMSDDQVMSYIAKEHTAGKDNAQIVTQLMQRGVNIQQIRRVRDKYQKQMSQNTSHSYGSAGDPTGSSRMRTNNGKKRTSGNESAGSNSDLSAYSNYRISNDRDSSDKEDEALEYRDELGKMIPDTAAIVKQYYDNKKTKAHKVFGRDIFNNKELSFEPNMNIATPQNYRLGPGDAVIIDIYGASQKSEQCTVSPDGDVVIEGYGPVAVSGLTVAQANARCALHLVAAIQAAA